MSEQEYLNRVARLPSDDVLRWASLERCRRYIADLVTADQNNPRIRELEALLPIGWKRIPLMEVVFTKG